MFFLFFYFKSDKTTRSSRGRIMRLGLRPSCETFFLLGKFGGKFIAHGELRFGTWNFPDETRRN